MNSKRPLTSPCIDKTPQILFRRLPIHIIWAGEYLARPMKATLTTLLQNKTHTQTHADEKLIDDGYGDDGNEWTRLVWWGLPEQFVNLLFMQVLLVRAASYVHGCRSRRRRLAIPGASRA